MILPASIIMIDLQIALGSHLACVLITMVEFQQIVRNLFLVGFPLEKQIAAPSICRQVVAQDSFQIITSYGAFFAFLSLPLQARSLPSLRNWRGAAGFWYQPRR